MSFNLKGLAEQTVALLFEPGFVRAVASWPTFSVTSFLMASRLRKLGLRPKTIIDVGANVGQFAVSMAKCFPEAMVHSYEPVPECHAKLKSAAGKLKNLQTSAIALGEEEGELVFNVNSHSHSSSALQLSDEHKRAFPFAQEVKKISVKVSTLDLEFGKRDLPGPVLLKLDVQGFEINVLRGAPKTLSRVDYIVLEMSFQPLYVGENTFHQILDFLDQRGFVLRQPLAFLNDPESGKYLQMDALFERSEDLLERSQSTSEEHIETLEHTR